DEVDFSSDKNSNGLTDLSETVRALELYYIDSDLDGVSDWIESVMGEDLTASNAVTRLRADTDGDGYSDFVEKILGTYGVAGISPDLSKDTNGDGITDFAETINALKLSEQDADSDDVADWIEVLMDEDLTSSNALQRMTVDTDNDGYSDFIELMFGTDIGNPSEKPNGSSDKNGNGITDFVETIVALDMSKLDADSDNVADWIEALMREDLTAANAYAELTKDTDSDGVSDFIEKLMGTDPSLIGDEPDLAKDTDGDGLSDFLEMEFVLGLDIDNDGILDAVEYLIYGDLTHMVTNDLRADTNGNSIADIMEKILEKHYASRAFADSDGDGIDDQLERDLWGDTSITGAFGYDSDGDGTADIIEYLLYGNLTSVGAGGAVSGQDSDNDGVADWIEILFGTDVNDPDSKPTLGTMFTDADDDGISDAKESSTRDTDSDGNPDRFDVDSDNDGYSDGEELFNGTNPFSVTSKPAYAATDTDSDGFTDVEEARMGSEPGVPGSKPQYNLMLDSDADGIANGVDKNPDTADSDTDGYSDGEEVRYGSSPFDINDKPKYPTTYKYLLVEGAKLKSQTFFYIDILGGEPQSIADYTLNYATDGVTIKDTTAYFYEDPLSVYPDVRATSADRDRRKTRVVTYRGDARSARLDYDADGIADRNESYSLDTDADGYFDFEDTDSDGDGYSDGEEILLGNDPIDKDDHPTYASGNVDADNDGFSDYFEIQQGTDPNDSSVKPDLTQANPADDDTLDGVGAPIGSLSGNRINDGIQDDAVRKTESFFYFRAGTLVGDEVMDYAYQYSTDGVSVRDTTIYIYETDKRASDISITVDSRKKWSVTYINDAISETADDDLDSDGVKDAAKKKTATRYYLDTAVTVAGDEIT
ncbi:MAG: hypothetical protein WCT15_07780, partial [Candidatus Omnitrophota bacterium]